MIQAKDPRHPSVQTLPRVGLRSGGILFARKLALDDALIDFESLLYVAVSVRGGGSLLLENTSWRELNLS